MKKKLVINALITLLGTFLVETSLAQTTTRKAPLLNRPPARPPKTESDSVRTRKFRAKKSIENRNKIGKIAAEKNAKEALQEPKVVKATTKAKKKVEPKKTESKKKPNNTEAKTSLDDLKLDTNQDFEGRANLVGQLLEVDQEIEKILVEAQENMKSIEKTYSELEDEKTIFSSNLQNQKQVFFSFYNKIKMYLEKEQNVSNQNNKIKKKRDIISRDLEEFFVTYSKISIAENDLDDDFQDLVNMVVDDAQTQLLDITKAQGESDKIKNKALNLDKSIDIAAVMNEMNIFKNSSTQSLQQLTNELKPDIEAKSTKIKTKISELESITAKLESKQTSLQNSLKKIGALKEATASSYEQEIIETIKESKKEHTVIPIPEVDNNNSLASNEASVSSGMHKILNSLSLLIKIIADIAKTIFYGLADIVHKLSASKEIYQKPKEVLSGDQEKPSEKEFENTTNDQPSVKEEDKSLGGFKKVKKESTSTLQDQTNTKANITEAKNPKEALKIALNNLVETIIHTGNASFEYIKHVYEKFRV